MGTKLAFYTRQKFFDVAVRRSAEAKMLLTPPHKFCDGAVTCGLLAAECALKATLLHGHRANSPDELPQKLQEAAFEGSAGHSISILWSLQSAHMRALQTDELQKALSHLSGPNRYEYRYGLKRPKDVHARPFSKSCDVVVSWMKGVIK